MKLRRGLFRKIALPFLLLLIFLFAPVWAARVVALVFLLVRLLAYVSAWLTPRMVSVSRDEQVVRANRFQRFEVSFRLTNRGILPLIGVRVTDGPGGLHTPEPPVFLVSLAPRETRHFSYEVEGHERGEFTVGPIELAGRDPFGFAPWRKREAAPLQVIVYPAVYALSLNQRTGLPSGNLTVQNRLYEDVTRFRSIREYAAGDELKRINWKVSARLGKLYVMEYLPSIYFPVLILLNLAQDDYPLGRRQQMVERAIEMAATLVFFYVGIKQEVGLLAAGRVAGAEGFPVVPIRAGAGHAVNILEILARIEPVEGSVDLGGHLFRSGVRIPTGTRVMVVTPPPRGKQRDALFEIKRRGLDVEVFLVGTFETRVEDWTLPGLRSHAVEEYGTELVHG